MIYFSGGIISVVERIPELHETVTIPPFVFTIQSVAKTHINTVQVKFNALTPTNGEIL